MNVWPGACPLGWRGVVCAWKGGAYYPVHGLLRDRIYLVCLFYLPPYQSGDSADYKLNVIASCVSHARMPWLVAAHSYGAYIYISYIARFINEIIVRFILWIEVSRMHASVRHAVTRQTYSTGDPLLV